MKVKVIRIESTGRTIRTPKGWPWGTAQCDICDGPGDVRWNETLSLYWCEECEQHGKV